MFYSKTNPIRQTLSLVRAGLSTSANAPFGRRCAKRLRRLRLQQHGQEKLHGKSHLLSRCLFTGQKGGARYLERSINDQFFLSSSQEALEARKDGGKEKEGEVN